jgi:hypothetical protein
VAYTDYQQRALYGAGQAAQRAGQRFHMERDALQRGDKAAAKYHRSRANALNRQGAYSAVRGMGGNQGANQYFPVQSSGQPIQAGSGIALSSAGRDIFDQFRDTGFVEPIRQKKRYAPNTEPRGLGWLMDQAMKNTIGGKILSSLGSKKPEPDDAYYKSLWGKGLNEMYSPSSVFKSGKFLGKPDLDPYYTGEADIPQDYSPFIEPPIELPIEPIIEDEIIEDTPLESTPIRYTEPPYLANDLLGWQDADIVNDAVGDGDDITKEEPFELQEAKFPIGNIGTDEYSPNMDLNIMNIQDPELRQAAMDAAVRFTQVYKEGEGGDYYGELENLYQNYLDAVKAGTQ